MKSRNTQTFPRLHFRSKRLNLKRESCENHLILFAFLEDVVLSNAHSLHDHLNSLQVDVSVLCQIALQKHVCTGWLYTLSAIVQKQWYLYLYITMISFFFQRWLKHLKKKNKQKNPGHCCLQSSEKWWHSLQFCEQHLCRSWPVDLSLPLWGKQRKPWATDANISSSTFISLIGMKDWTYKSQIFFYTTEKKHLLYIAQTNNSIKSLKTIWVWKTR